MSTSTRNILFGQGDVNGIITPLIPFNCVYDIDAGLVRFMYENGFTNNSNLVDGTFFNQFSMKRVVRSLYSRSQENPLSLFVDSKDIDNMYNEFMTKHYEQIVRSSVHTGIYDLCSTFKTDKSILGSIIYSNEAEYYMLRGDPKLKGVELVDLESLSEDLKEYNCFFFKSLDDMYISLFVHKIKSKAVYVMDYKFNFEGNTLKETATLDILKYNRNIINIINAYDRQRLGLGEP